MVLAKPASMKPRDIAETLQAKLAGAGRRRRRRCRRAGLPQPHVQARGLARPGARHPRRRRQPTAARTSGNGETVNVEYVSANPTGPMHVGHCRGAVFGDALANLLAFAGYDVTREYYINDAGGQVDVLARSAFLRYREALGEDIGEIPAGPLSRRLPEAGRRSARQGARRRAARHAGGANGCRSCARSPSTQMMDDDPGRSRRAQHPARRVLLGSLADHAAAPTRSRRRSTALRAKGLIYEGSWRSPRATTTTSGRTASRRCSSRPSSATTRTAR